MAIDITNENVRVVLKIPGDKFATVRGERLLGEKLMKERTREGKRTGGG